MITDATYAQLADAAYQNTGAPVGWTRLPDRPLDNPVGYDGAAFGRTDATGKIVEIVIASRGTEPFTFDGDMTGNFQMAANQVPDQYQNGQKFLRGIQARNS